LRDTAGAVRRTNNPAFGACGERLAEAVDSLDRATQWILATGGTDPGSTLAGATPYLRLFASAAGGCLLADEALASLRLGDGVADAPGRIATARFFAENIAVHAGALERAVVEGAGSIAGMHAAPLE
jgi:hypothetical protein